MYTVMTILGRKGRCVVATETPNADPNVEDPGNAVDVVDVTVVLLGAVDGIAAVLPVVADDEVPSETLLEVVEVAESDGAFSKEDDIGAEEDTDVFWRR